MVVKYNGKYYFCYKLSNNLLISTKKIEKSDGTFTKDGDYWYKKVRLDNEKITDVFEVDLYVKYNVGLQDVPKVWHLEMSRTTIKNNSVKLVFHNGILPGWKAEDPTISYKYININEIKGGSIKKTFYKKDGKLYVHNIVYNKKAPISEIIRIEKDILDI